MWRSTGLVLTANQIGTLNVEFGRYAPITASVGKEIITNGAPINAGLQESEGDIILTAGMYIRVWDSAAIDAAADDLTVVLHYVEYDA